MQDDCMELLLLYVQYSLHDLTNEQLLVVCGYRANGSPVVALLLVWFDIHHIRIKMHGSSAAQFSTSGLLLIFVFHCLDLSSSAADWLSVVSCRSLNWSQFRYAVLFANLLGCAPNSKNVTKSRWGPGRQRTILESTHLSLKQTHLFILTLIIDIIKSFLYSYIKPMF